MQVIVDCARTWRMHALTWWEFTNKNSVEEIYLYTVHSVYYLNSVHCTFKIKTLMSWVCSPHKNNNAKKSNSGIEENHISDFSIHIFGSLLICLETCAADYKTTKNQAF